MEITLYDLKMYLEAFDKELIKKQYPYPIATYFAKTFYDFS